ncbi:MAG: class I SAM-dependent methyltransferase [Chloroflexi bacterium]|nr:class I SAM-dependent methyltransferase [Chloroflexota bacterium]
MQNNEFSATLFSDLERINARPKPFEFYTASDLWTDEHTSAQMLAFHLNENVDLSSRRHSFIEQSVEWLVSRMEIGQGTRVVDFGCGPGLYTSRLAQRGAQVTGIDFSGRSIKYAREQARAAGLDIQYVNQNYLDFTTDQQFDVVLMIFCDLCALSPAQRQTMLTKFRSILTPGGRIVLDVHSLAMFERRNEETHFEFNLQNGFWSAAPYYGFLNIFKYEAEQVTLDKYTLVERARTRTVYNWLQYFSVDSLRAEFREAGLTICGVYGDVAGKPYDAETDEFAVMAEKASS